MGALKARAGSSTPDISRKVRAVIESVRQEGDAALLRFCRQFDGFEPASLCLSQQEISACKERVDPKLRKTMEKAAENIRAYHEKQLCSGYEISKGGKTLGRIVPPAQARRGLCSRGDSRLSLHRFDELHSRRSGWSGGDHPRHSAQGGRGAPCHRRRCGNRRSTAHFHYRRRPGGCRPGVWDTICPGSG